MKKLVVLALICSSFLVYAQSAAKLISKGEVFFKDNKFTKALEFFEQAYAIDPKNVDLNYKMGLCYLATFPKSKSLQYLRQAIENSPKPTKEMYLAYAGSLHINHQFDKAIEFYKKADPGNTNAKATSKSIKECEFGKKYLASPQDFKITNLGERINTPQAEYLPRITADMMTMYFTSRRTGSTGGKLDVDDSPFEDVYMCKNKGGAWDAPMLLTKPINSEIHDACVGVSEDGQTMFVYKGSNGGDIFETELKGDKWGELKSVSINTEQFESSPSLSPDERKIFFVKKTSTGSKDIYTCSRGIHGAWSKPIKISDNINTPYDEESPYMHPDGKTLYFSSKGHSSMGGYDIFKSTYSGGVWSVPENLGYPLNTALDDVYFVLSADGKVGFYSSEKESGFGKQDLYSVRTPTTYHRPDLTLFAGKITDAVTNLPLEAKIFIQNNETNELVAELHSNAKTGEYLISLPSGINYNITVEKNEYLFHSENVHASLNEGFKKMYKDVKLITMKPGASVILNNLFFESGKNNLSDESNAELFRLVKLLKTTPKLRLEISGHTDNTGNLQANQKLSQDRAKAVVDFLISNGVDKSRLVAKGYGSDQPVAPNDTPEGRQLNRRTEFKVLAN